MGVIRALDYLSFIFFKKKYFKLTCFMRLLPLFIILFPFFSCNNGNAVLSKKINAHIAEIQKKYVPDKRLALFNVNIDSPNNSAIVLTGETIIPEAKKELLDLLKKENIQFKDNIEVLPSAELESKNFGVVNLSVCNIRSKGKHSAELGTQAMMGTPLRVYKKEGSFYFIQTPDNYLGWVDAGGLELMNQKEYNDWLKAEKTICTADYSFAYKMPDENSEKVTDLIAGNILKTIGAKNNFTEIALPDGRSGFVKSGDIMPYKTWLDSRSLTAENILADAKNMMGRPYLWGGTSGKAMDCSGFTKTVYFLNGVQLERDASLQVHTGISIETDTATLKNLLPGDLLFFGKKATPEKKERISHVAIYMGDGKIIHATGKIKIESLKRGDEDFAEHRLNTFIRAKRVIGSVGKNGIVALKDSPYYQVN
ncbi:MAG TPA: glycoside hydrolase [Bacteroidetes bacterium]|nr:glycoside hydrolase [Bacteroidota bacterium]